MKPEVLKAVRNGFLIGALAADIAFCIATIVQAHRRDKAWDTALQADLTTAQATSGASQVSD